MNDAQAKPVAAAIKATPMAEALPERTRMRFGLRTIFGVTLLYALALGVVAVVGHDWTLTQHGHFSRKL